MQRSSPLYGAGGGGGGPSSGTAVPPLLAPLSSVSHQEHHQEHQEEYDLGSPVGGGRGGLKRKLPPLTDQLVDARYTVAAPYSPIAGDASPKAKPARKEPGPMVTGCSLELHEFPAFGQAFQGVSGIGQFYVIGPNDTNNNAPQAHHLHHQHHHHHQPQQQQQHHHHHQQLEQHQLAATYIYDVPVSGPQQHTGVDAGAPQVVPITEHQLLSAVAGDTGQQHQPNGIVLTDISSSTWTTTAELLDLDRKAAAPTSVHHPRYSIVSAEQHHHQQQHHHHHHHHHQQQQQQQHQQNHHQHGNAPRHPQLQQQQLPHQSSLQQLQHIQHHQPTQQQQQPASCPSSPRPPATPGAPTPVAGSSPSHPVSTQHHNNQQASQQYVAYGGGVDAPATATASTTTGSPYGNNQSTGWTEQQDAGRTGQPASPRMEPTGRPAGTLPNASQTPDTPEDCKNLSWLLNFKLDDIPNLSPRSSRKQRSKSNATGGGGGGSGAGGATDAGGGAGGGGSGVGGTGSGGNAGDPGGTVAIEEGDLNVGENVTIESSSGKSPKKPPFTYTELIEYALEEQGDLTVAAIYQWISDHFPYYKSHDDRWKNSVRHNLSINPHFRKGRKSSHGSGHLWTISSRNSEDNFLAWEHKKQRFEWFFKMEANARVRELGTATDSMTDDEVAAATASLAQYVPKSPSTSGTGAAGPARPAGAETSPACQQALEAMSTTTSDQNHHLPPAQTLQQQQQHQHQHQQQHQQQQQQQQQHQLGCHYQQTQTLYADIITSAQFEVTTAAVAEELKHPDEDGTLHGAVRRGPAGAATEIQIVRPAQTIQTYEMLDAEYSIADYLNPVPKEEIVQECGLRSVALDPAELGINIPSASGQDEDILFDDFSLNYFGNNIMT